MGITFSGVGDAGLFGFILLLDSNLGLVPGEYRHGVSLDPKIYPWERKKEKAWSMRSLGLAGVVIVVSIVSFCI